MFTAYEECKVNLTDTACNQLANICILQANSLGACDLLDDSMGSLVDADGRNMGWIEKMPFIGGLGISFRGILKVLKRIIFYIHILIYFIDMMCLKHTAKHI